MTLTLGFAAATQNLNEGGARHQRGAAEEEARWGVEKLGGGGGGGGGET